MKRLLAIFILAGFAASVAAAQQSSPPPPQQQYHVSHGDTAQTDSMEADTPAPPPKAGTTHSSRKKAKKPAHKKHQPRKTEQPNVAGETHATQPQ